MDIIVKEGVKIPNAVLVSGLTQTDVDNEVFDFLSQYGSISRIIKVPTTDPVTQAIVEFEYGSAIRGLETIGLPYQRPCVTKPDVVHHVQSLASAYTRDVGASATDTYLEGLKDLAKRSGMDFGDILRRELSRISESISTETQIETRENPTETEPPPTQSDVQATAPSFVSAPTEVSQAPYRPQTGIEVRDFPPPEGERGPFHLPSDQLSTPEVQRVVVEHIIKSSEISSHLHSPCKLKQFSGRLPQPTFEVDYETWRNGVEFCLNDPSVPDSQVVRKIVESLSPPAANIIKSLGPQASPKEYVTLLDSAYATVEDGDELFARFLNNNQNAGEKASDYLQRLHTALSYVIAKGGISAHDIDKQLLKQFCRGCWNSLLITSLQLEQLKSKPPSFAELLLLLRTEEDKQANKASRMKQHLGFTKLRAMSNVQAAHLSCTEDVSPPQEAEQAFLAMTKDIQKQIAELQVQVAKLSSCSAEKPGKKKVTVSTRQKQKTKNTQPEGQLQQITAMVKPKPWYCFKCGEDGHIASTCNNMPNPTLVQAKKAELREKQRAWEAQNSSHATPRLN